MLFCSMWDLIKNHIFYSVRGSKYWSFSFSISPSNEYSGLFPLGLIGLISLLSQGLSNIFSSTTIQNHQFFSTQPSWWSNSHIHTWQLEKPKLWLYRPLSEKWCLSFLIHYLGLKMVKMVQEKKKGRRKRKDLTLKTERQRSSIK